MRRPSSRKLRGSVVGRSEEHTSELQSHSDIVCRLLLEKKKKQTNNETPSGKAWQYYEGTEVLFMREQCGRIRGRWSCTTCVRYRHAYVHSLHYPGAYER